MNALSEDSTNTKDGISLNSFARTYIILKYSRKISNSCVHNLLKNTFFIKNNL